MSRLNWPMHALYATVTYAAQNLLNLVPNDDLGDCDMMEDFYHFQNLDVELNGEQPVQSTLRLVDLLHQHSFSVIAAAMEKDPVCRSPYGEGPRTFELRTWLSEAQQHQAILAHAVEYLYKLIEARAAERRRFG
jgi:hypothetical protein